MALLRDHPILHRYLRARFQYLAQSDIDVHVAWPDETELIGVLFVDADVYFLGGLGIESHRAARPGEYRGLSDEEGAEIAYYRAFKLFQPWPTPILTVNMNAGGLGHVVSPQTNRVPVRMQEVGSAQAWWGPKASVIWEVLLSKSSFPDSEKFRRAYIGLWGQVESHLRTHGVRVFVTEHDDPAFDRDWYHEVLSSMGYRKLADGAFRKEAAP